MIIGAGIERFRKFFIFGEGNFHKILTLFAEFADVLMEFISDIVVVMFILGWEIKNYEFSGIRLQMASDN